jgi:hypothetical protein
LAFLRQGRKFKKLGLLQYLPMDFLKACVNDSVLDISSEKISEPASIVKGVSSPKLFAMPMLQRKKSTIFVEFV